jgi:hypothetical protein
VASVTAVICAQQLDWAIAKQIDPMTKDITRRRFIELPPDEMNS